MVYVPTFAVLMAFFALSSAAPTSSQSSEAHLDAAWDSTGKVSGPLVPFYKTSSDTLSPQETTSFDVFGDINYSGRHEQLFNDAGYCYDLKNGWNDIVSSAYAHENGYACCLWEHVGCHGAQYCGISRSGVANLGSAWNDRASSYHCYRI